MAIEKKSVFVLYVLLLVLFASQGEGGRLCQSQSREFKGPCLRHHNCALVCRNEGFSGGRCRGFRHRWFCTKPCYPNS